MNNSTKIIILIVVIIIAIAALMIVVGKGERAPITSFEECVAAGNPVMESYPRQCSANGVTYIETVVVDDGADDVTVVTTSTTTATTTIEDDGVACTMEAKQCPDGSYVGRTGPKCEFALCPGN